MKAAMALELEAHTFASPSEPSCAPSAAPRALAFASEEERLVAFGRALDALRDEIEAEIGAEDVEHMRRIRALSRRMELLGRVMIWGSFEPLGFGLGVGALWLHKVLELMEIGHTLLHGTFDRVPNAEDLSSRGFDWKAPIDELSWCTTHNLRHHQYTNVAGRDPDLDFGGLRLSSGVKHRRIHRLQPLSNLFTWLGFAAAINFHVTGVLDIYGGRAEPPILPDREPGTLRAARRSARRKLLRYYTREYVGYPLLSGPFMPKALLGNLLSEVGRDVYAAATIYCGHVGATEFPHGTRTKGRGAWYALQVEGSYDIEVPRWVSVLCGALDKQIEHHLFPRLPPNRLRQIAPRVRAICEAHGVRYRSASWPSRLREVARTLHALSWASAPAPVQQ